MKRSTLVLLIFGVLVVSIPLFSSCRSYNAADTKNSRKTPETTSAAGHESDPVIELEHYTLSKKGGQWRLSLFGEREELPGPGEVLRDLSFDDLDQLIDALKNDRFSEEQMKKIALFPKDENGILLFDVDDPARAVIPEGFAVSHVNWYGESYDFFITDSDGNDITLMCCTEESFRGIFKQKYESFLTNADFKIEKEESGSGREVYRCESSRSVIRVVRYEPLPGIYVEERYMLDAKGDDVLKKAVGGESEDKPYRVNVYNDAGTVKYALLITNPTRMFSEDEVLAFRLSK